MFPLGIAASAASAASSVLPSLSPSLGLFGSSALSGLLSGGISTGGDIFSSRMNYKYNKELQDRAFAHQIRMYKNQHQWAVQDLRKAGLNPILATHSASSMPSAPTASVSVPSFGQNFKFDKLIDYLSKEQGFKNSKQMYAFNELLHALQLSEVNSRINVNSALASKYASETDQINSATAFEFSNEVLRLKKRQMKYNSSGEIGKRLGIPDEVLYPDSNSAHDGFYKEQERKKYVRQQFWNSFKKDLRRNYKKSFPFLGL